MLLIHVASLLSTQELSHLWLRTSFLDPNMSTEEEQQPGHRPLQHHHRTMRGGCREEEEEVMDKKKSQEDQLVGHGSSYFLLETAPQESCHGCLVNPHSWEAASKETRWTSKHRTFMQTPLYLQRLSG